MLKYLLVSVLALTPLLGSGKAASQDVDPTRPVLSERVAGGERTRPPELRLQSIFYQPGNSRALINGETYRIGDEVAGFTVVDIAQEQVELERNGQELLLSVFGPQRVINGGHRP